MPDAERTILKWTQRMHGAAVATPLAVHHPPTQHDDGARRRGDDDDDDDRLPLFLLPWAVAFRDTYKVMATF